MHQSARLFVVLPFMLLCAASVQAQLPPAGDPAHPGRAVFEQFCATCHGNPEFPRALAFETLRMMNSDALSHALTEGLMAAQGAARWVRSGQASGNQGMVTGSPVIHQDRIIVPISGSGVLAGGNPRYECCENHGAVTALDATTGDRIWEYHTMPAATYNGMENSLGVRMKGPSGAPIWSTPTVDAKRGLVYVTTGENTSHPTAGAGMLFIGSGYGQFSQTPGNVLLAFRPVSR